MKSNLIKLKGVKISTKAVLVLILFSVFALPILALGYQVAPTVGIINALNKIVNWVYTFFFFVATLFIIIAAYYFVTAQGKPEQINQARAFLLWAVIGVIVAILARGIVLWLQETIK